MQTRRGEDFNLQSLEGVEAIWLRPRDGEVLGDTSFLNSFGGRIILLGKEKQRFSLTSRGYSVLVRVERVFCSGGVLFWTKPIQILDKFISGNDRSTLELAAPASVKAGDPFLRIKKKMRPVLNLNARRKPVACQFCLPDFLGGCSHANPKEPSHPEKKRERYHGIGFSSGGSQTVEGESQGHLAV